MTDTLFESGGFEGEVEGPIEKMQKGKSGKVKKGKSDEKKFNDKHAAAKKKVAKPSELVYKQIIVKLDLKTSKYNTDREYVLLSHLGEGMTKNAWTAVITKAKASARIVETMNIGELEHVFAPEIVQAVKSSKSKTPDVRNFLPADVMLEQVPVLREERGRY